MVSCCCRDNSRSEDGGERIKSVANPDGEKIERRETREDEGDSIRVCRRAASLREGASCCGELRGGRYQNKGRLRERPAQGDALQA